MFQDKFDQDLLRISPHHRKLTTFCGFGKEWLVLKTGKKKKGFGGEPRLMRP
jgi:hypothetical protein